MDQNKTAVRGSRWRCYSSHLSGIRKTQTRRPVFDGLFTPWTTPWTPHPVGTSYTAVIIVFKKKESTRCKTTIPLKRPGRKLIMEIQRPPEVASKTHSPVISQRRGKRTCQHVVQQTWLETQIIPSEEARWTSSPEQIDCQ